MRETDALELVGEGRASGGRSGSPLRGTPRTIPTHRVGGSTGCARRFSSLGCARTFAGLVFASALGFRIGGVTLDYLIARMQGEPRPKANRSPSNREESPTRDSRYRCRGYRSERETIETVLSTLGLDVRY